MARIRTIKPSFFSSLTVASVPKLARLTFIGLWGYVDDEGRGLDDARLIKAAVWPLDDDYTLRKVDADLRALDDAGLIRRYEAAGRRYLHVVGMATHQRISKPQKSTLPPPPEAGTVADESTTVPAPVAEQSRNVPPPLRDPSAGERKGKEGKGKEPPSESRGTATGAAPPAADADEEPINGQPLPDELWANIARRKLALRRAEGGQIGGDGSKWMRAVATADQTNPDLVRQAQRWHQRYDLTVDELASFLVSFERGDTIAPTRFHGRERTDAG